MASTLSPTPWGRMAALTRDRTHNLLLYRMTLQPTEPPGQGSHIEGAVDLNAESCRQPVCLPTPTAPFVPDVCALVLGIVLSAQQPCCPWGNHVRWCDDIHHLPACHAHIVRALRASHSLQAASSLSAGPGRPSCITESLCSPSTCRLGRPETRMSLRTWSLWFLGQLLLCWPSGSPAQLQAGAPSASALLGLWGLLWAQPTTALLTTLPLGPFPGKPSHVKPPDGDAERLARQMLKGEGRHDRCIWKGWLTVCLETGLGGEGVAPRKSRTKRTG